MRRTRKQPAIQWEDGPTPASARTAIVTRAPNTTQYHLPLEAALPAGRSPDARAPESGQLWFCVYLPELPLEAIPVAQAESGGARVLFEEQRGIQRVLLADPSARAAGIAAGQSANAALALKPDIELIERSKLCEQQALETLACWLERFSSRVSIAGPDVLVLEIAGSLRLFGGLRALRRQIAQGLDAQRFTAGLAIAPTPLSATWLARDGRRACIRNAANLMPALRGLSLYCLDWPVATCRALKGMGIQNLGDCFRLPREGLVRRFGSRLLMQLDQAVGRLPDPRTVWRAPERFSALHDMTAEQSDRDLLLAICRSLLERHERFLLMRQQGTQQIQLKLFHLRAAATVLSVGGADVERSAEHWFDLLKIRFEQFRLPEPVIAVRLEGGQPRLLGGRSAGFEFGRRPVRSVTYSMRQLAERLTARMGEEAVYGVRTLAEHRPQCAWRRETALAESSHAQGAPVLLQRPLWLLPEPEVLSVREGHPWYEGPLHLLSGPERLETGWWDSDGISRDYYRARNPRGLTLWVFRVRERRADSESWYLQGYFG
ncbi:MAG: DNA polymerase Y family protein [Pseudomonadota bacterium]